MTKKLTREAYVKLIDEDLKWLRLASEALDSLEFKHISDVLLGSVENEYDVKPCLVDMESEVAAIKKERDEALAILHDELETRGVAWIERMRALRGATYEALRKNAEMPAEGWTVAPMPWYCPCCSRGSPPQARLAHTPDCSLAELLRFYGGEGEEARQQEQQKLAKRMILVPPFSNLSSLNFMGLLTTASVGVFTPHNL